MSSAVHNILRTQLSCAQSISGLAAELSGQSTLTAELSRQPTHAAELFSINSYAFLGIVTHKLQHQSCLVCSLVLFNITTHPIWRGQVKSKNIV